MKIVWVVLALGVSLALPHGYTVVERKKEKTFIVFSLKVKQTL